MTLFNDETAEEAGRTAHERRRKTHLSTRATLGVTLILIGGIGCATAGGLWISINGLGRQAEESGLEQAAGAARRLETLAAASAANVANALDIVLDDQLRAQAAATAMLIEAAEAAGHSPRYIEDALRQITARSPMRRIDVVGQGAQEYSSEQERLNKGDLETELPAPESTEPGTTASAPAVHAAGGLAKAAGATMGDGVRTVRIEQTLESAQAAATYGSDDDRTGRELADQQAGAIAQLITHAVELGEDAGWGGGAIRNRLDDLVDGTSVQGIRAAGGEGQTVYQAGATAARTPEEEQSDEARGQGVTILGGWYDEAEQWISRARATRANGRLAITVRLATRAGGGSLAETAWQVEASQIARMENVSAVWVGEPAGRNTGAGLRLAAWAPRGDAVEDDAEDPAARWPETERFARETLSGKTAASRSTMGLLQGARATVTAGAVTAAGTVVIIETRTDEVLARMRNEAVTAAAAAALLILMIGAVTTAVVRRWLTGPVEAIASAAETLEHGERPADALTEKLERRSDEVGSLAFSFNKMRDRMLARHEELQDLVDDRTRRIQAANEDLERTKAQIEREINLARTVQESLAPPALETHGRLVIASRITPAKELGGDFVVTRRLNDGRIVVAVCDVSGKGVAAGLFMAVARAAVHTAAEQEVTAAGIAREANERLTAGNTLSMFVTGFIAIVDAASGSVEYACAGHEPPIRVGRHGEQSTLEGTTDPPLALVEGQKFETHTYWMQPEENLVAYTDGITDACDADETEFGKERLQEVLQKAPGTESPDKTINRLWGTIRAFSGETPATDDKTAAVLHLSEATAS